MMTEKKKEPEVIRENAGRHELYVGDRCIAACVSEASVQAARRLLLGPDPQERARL